MNDKLEFPELKRAYLQSLPSERAILARMRHKRPPAEAVNSRLAFLGFGLVGAAGLVALLLIRTPNEGGPQAQLSAEPLHATSVAARGVPSSDSPSNVVAPERNLVDEDRQRREPAVTNQVANPPEARRTTPQRSGPTRKVDGTVAPGGKATWSEVGTLLRNGQEAEAQRKIAELAHSEDVETREGAVLFQLRQTVQAARKTQTAVDPTVRAALQKLADSGSTSSIRLTAKRLLADSL